MPYRTAIRVNAWTAVVATALLWLATLTGVWRSVFTNRDETMENRRIGVERFDAIDRKLNDLSARVPATRPAE